MPDRPKIPKPLPSKPGSPGEQEEDNPQVIVDVIFKEGLFLLAVENLGDLPAWRVSVQWEPSFRGLGGSQPTSELPLFKNIEFLAPHKTITTLLDTCQAYFQRAEPTRLTARVKYLAADRKYHTATITHDLAIYQDLTYLTERRQSNGPTTG